MKKIFTTLLLLSVAAFSFSQDGTYTNLSVRNTLKVPNWIIYQGDTLSVVYVSGDTIFVNSGVSQKDTILNLWSQTGNDITHTNTGKVTINGDSLYLYPLPDEATKVGRIATLLTNGEVEWASLVSLYKDMQDTVYLIPTTRTTWLRDTLNGYIYPAHLTDNVGIGTATPTQKLDVIGNIRATGNFNFSTTNHSTMVGITTGSDTLTESTGVGESALNTSSMDYTTAIGYSAGSDAVGDYGTFFGNSAGSNNNGDKNISLGVSSGTSQTGNNNINIGYNTGQAATTNNCINIGYEVGAAGNENNKFTIGQKNLNATTLMQGDLLTNMLTVRKLTVDSSLYLPATTSSTVGNLIQNGIPLFHTYTEKSNSNLFFGQSAGNYTADSTKNHAFGTFSLAYLTTGHDNSMMGYWAGKTITTGYGNVAMGDYAMNGTISGYSNVAVGSEAGDGNSGGYLNTWLGYNSGSQSGGTKSHYRNVGIGYDALVMGSAGVAHSDNIAIGMSSGTGLGGSSTTMSNNNLFIGSQSGNGVAGATGAYARYNIGLGTNVMKNLGASASKTPIYNIIIGNDAMYNASYTDGDYNIAIGNWTLKSLTDGVRNIIMGDSAGYSLTTGDSNIFIGNKAGYAYTTESHKLDLGGAITGDLETGNMAISGDLNLSSNNIDAVDTATVDDLNMTDPSMWMDNFRKRPFYMNDFLSVVTGTFDPWSGLAIASGTVGSISGHNPLNHPGQIRINSSTTTNSGYAVLANSSSLYGIRGGEISNLIFYPNVLDSATTRFGFHDATTITAPVDGAYFEIGPDSVLWGKTMKASAGSTTGTSYMLAVNTWYRLKLVVNADATRVDYYVYNDAGTQLWTDNLTTNIPTGYTGHGVISTKEHTGTGEGIRLFHVDYMDVYLGNLIR